MDFNSEAPSSEASDLKPSAKTDLVMEVLQSLSIDQISNIMKVSPKIAELNYQRFQGFENSPEKQALFAYTGDVYKNIDSHNFSSSELKFAQGHLRIISALYGVLSPLDKIKAYRLEMSNKLPDIAPTGMHVFWKEGITKQLNIELNNHKNKFLINISSNEYSASIDNNQLNAPIITMHFREKRNGELKNIALNAKRARGMLADYIIKNAIDLPDDIKSFNKGSYNFDTALSDNNNFFFIR